MASKRLMEPPIPLIGTFAPLWRAFDAQYQALRKTFAEGADPVIDGRIEQLEACMMLVRRVASGLDLPVDHELPKVNGKRLDPSKVSNFGEEATRRELEKFGPLSVVKRLEALERAVFERSTKGKAQALIEPKQAPPSAGPEIFGQSARGAILWEAAGADVGGGQGRLSRTELAILSFYSPTSSTFDNAVRELLEAGHLEKAADHYQVTAKGFESLRKSDLVVKVNHWPASELLARWGAKLEVAEGTMLQSIAQVDSIDRQTLSALSGYSVTSSTFDNAQRRLRELKFVSPKKGWPIAAHPLFRGGS